MSSNPNATAAALTSVFVWALSTLLEHFHVVEFSPNQILAIAGAATTFVLWIGREGILGAAERIWYGAKAIAGVKTPTEPPPPAAPPTDS